MAITDETQSSQMSQPSFAVKAPKMTYRNQEGNRIMLSHSPMGGLLRTMFYLFSVAATMFAILTVGYVLCVYVERTVYSPVVQYSTHCQLSLMHAGLTVVGSLITMCAAVCMYKFCYTPMKLLLGLLVLVAFALCVAGLSGVMVMNQMTHDLWIEAEMKMSMEQLYGYRGARKVTNGWDAMQADLHCCGMSVSEWHHTRWAMFNSHLSAHEEHHDNFSPLDEMAEKHGGRVPRSCCQTNSAGELEDMYNCLYQDKDSVVEREHYMYTKFSLICIIQSCFPLFRDYLIDTTRETAMLSFLTGLSFLLPAVTGLLYTQIIVK